MPVGCENIDKNILLDCVNPLVGGTNDRLILIPFDVAQNLAITYDVNNPIVITAIAPGSPTPGYVYEGQNQSVDPLLTGVKLTYSYAYDHQVQFKVFSNTPDVKEQIQRLGFKKVVAIVQTNYTGVNGNGAFHVYGLKTGLELQEITANPNDPDTLGAYDVILRNKENSRPATLPHTIFNTDFITTKAIVDALVNV
jgi:hypothetical protein